ncbi:MAG: Hsp33 family molecular chaperone HslO [Oscillospiraceae bacterium]|nr:Hsp33 family molecular chaperone HslO [Oscillospiraceae bacterium]
MGKIIRAVAGDDFIKIAIIEARDIVEKARLIHGLSPTASAALGRTLCAASLMGNMMKEEDAAVTVRINGGGPIGSILAVADCEGNVRGYVDEPGVDLPLRSDGKIDVGGAVGCDGTLTVSKDIGLREPYVGSVNLISGEIAEDFSAYYVESEQIPAACGLGVLVDTDCSIRAAGGFIVQLMPGAPDGLIEKLEDNIFFMDQLTTILDEDGMEEIMAQVLKGLEPRILEESEVEYRCYCSRERVSEALRSVGAAALEEIAAQGSETEVGCQFCDRTYIFTPEDIRGLI